MSLDDLPPIENAGGTVDPDESGGVFGTPWDRRTFLKSAALGTATAAMASGGSLFAPLTAYAQAGDLSSLNCTANDVRIPAPGQVLNEPCPCTPGSTFNALVRIPIVNNTGTTRYCVTAHLCAARDSAGNIIFAARDIVLGDIAANFDGTVDVTIPGYPCGAGLLCFGARGPAADGSFPKGVACPAGACCSTISWNVKASDPCPDTTRQITSKCRHQQICIQGRGISLDCDTTTDGVQTSCSVACGGTANLNLCVTGAKAPYVFELSDGQRFPVGSGTTTATCHVFTTSAITADTTFTGTVTDADGCVQTAQVTLTTTAISPALTVSGNTACLGVLTFSTTVAGQSGCGFTYSVDGTDVDPLADPIETDEKIIRLNGDDLEFRWLDGNCHTISVAANCGGCQGSDSKTVDQCVTTNIDKCTPSA